MTDSRTRMFDRLLHHAGQPLTRHRMLCAHLDYAWDLARPRMDGLTDEEYLYCPAKDCWTVRHGLDGRAVADWAHPVPDPPPFTTIAWRLTHLAMWIDLRADHWFGPATLQLTDLAWPIDAAGGLGWLDHSYRRLRDGVEMLPEDDLDDHLVGPPGTADEQFPAAMAVQHMTLELIHHGAEIALLRDLVTHKATKAT